MLTTEIGKTLRDTLITLSFGLLLPVVYWINENRLTENEPFSDYLEAGAIIIAVALIAKLSYSMFSGEDSDNAFEYLKTLPIPRWKLAGFKILPRLIVSGLILTGLKEFAEVVNLLWYELPILVLSLFSGFFLGIAGRKNAVLIVLFLVPVFYLLMVAPVSGGLMQYHTHFNGYLTWSLAMLIGFLPLASLWGIYRKWDCSSRQERTGKMILRMTGPAALITVIGIYTFSSF